jgi:hypothetical protein
MTFGDDIQAAVSKKCEWFNVYSMSKKLGEYNIYFTSGSKSKPTEEDAKLMCLLDCEFLKQTTIVRKNAIPGVHFYPFAMEDSLIKTLSYSNSELSILEAVVVNGNDVLGRVWSSGVERFTLWRERIWSVWRKLGIREIPLSYPDLYKRWERGEIRSDVYTPYVYGNVYSYLPDFCEVTDEKWIAQSGECAQPVYVCQSGVEEIKVPTVVPTEATPAVSLGDASSDTKVDGYNVELKSVGTIIKRRYPMLFFSGATTTSFPVATPFCGTLNEAMSASILRSCGLLRYFAQFYRTYAGNIRLVVLCTNEVPITISTSSDSVVVSRNLADSGAGSVNGSVAHGNRTLGVQIPFITRFPILRTPWFPTEVFKDTSNVGTVALSVPAAPGNSTVYVGAGDGFRFATLCRIPRFRIVGSNYPHYGGTAVDVGEFIAFTMSDSGFALPLSQLILNTMAPIRTLTLPATGIAEITNFTVLGASLTDDQLRVLGYAIKAGQPRNVLTGVTTSKAINTGSLYMYCVPYTWTINPTPSSTVSDPHASFHAVGSGTTYSFVDQWGVNNQLATTWTTHTENWDYVPWRDALGIPTSAILIANNDSAVAALPQTLAYTTAGYTLTRWSNDGVNSTFAKGFGAPVSTKFKETKATQKGRRRDVEVKHDFVMIPQSGKVTIVGGTPVQTTDGGVKTIPNVMTMGEVVPSNIAVVEKEQLVESLAWNTSDAVGSVLTYYDVPFDLIKSRVMQSAFSRYLFWRGNVTLRVQLQCNTFMNGSIVVAWLPLMTSSQAMFLCNGNLRSLSITKHAVLYAGKCSTVDLTVPYLHNKSHLDLRVATDDNSLGCFVVYVMNQLRVGASATSTSATLSTFASFSGSDFAVINPTSISVVPQGGIQSKVTNINIEHAMNATLDASTTGDNFQGGSTTAPMDLPNIGLNWSPVISNAYPVITNTSNVDHLTVMDTAANTRPITKPVDTGTSVDEMEMSYLTSKMSFVSSFTVNNTNAVGEAVFVGDLCPAFELFTLPLDSSFAPTLLSAVSFPFSFWKGSLVYKIVAVASPIHTCRLQICSHIGYESSGLEVNEAFGQYVSIFEVCGVSEITVSFPWRSPTEWKKVNTGSNSDTGNYSMGQFSVRVLNALQTMESVSSDIDLNVYYCGGPDYELTGLGNNAIDLIPVDNDL